MQHCKEAAADLNQQFRAVKQTGNLPIFLVQEPYHYRNKICGFTRNINVFSLPVPGKSPRSAIIAPSFFNIWMMPEFSSEDVTTCYWSTGDASLGDVYLVSAYLDITHQVIPDTLQRLIDFCVHGPFSPQSKYDPLDS